MRRLNMNAMKTQLTLLSLCCALVTQVMDANELRFAFDSDSAHARDHVVIPFPEINEIPEGGLSFRVETSYDLAKWKEMHTIHFELSSETQIQGSFMKDILRVDPDTRNFNFL